MTELKPRQVIRPSSGGSLYDARWTQLMVFILKRFPTSVCVILTRPAAFVFYLFARVQGHAVRANLSALFPDWSALRCWMGAYQVFNQFALTYLDRLLYRHCSRQVEWDVHGMEVFKQMQQEAGGVLVFTLHSGNYDIGSSILAEHLERPLHIVRAPERSRPLDEFRAAELHDAASQQPYLRFHYNTPGGHLGIDLCRLLLAGEIVAVQGDRVVMDVSPLTVVHEGVSYTIPCGPLMLAETARVPCYPILLTRLGVCRYRSEVLQPFFTGQCKMKRAELAALWIPVMADFIHRNWNQWFVFEPMIQRVHDEPPLEGGSIATKGQACG
jgi:lauroyl/myristoyl acyltransferase